MMQSQLRPRWCHPAGLLQLDTVRHLFIQPQQTTARTERPSAYRHDDQTTRSHHSGVSPSSLVPCYCPHSFRIRTAGIQGTHYKFITQFAGERILKIGEHLAKLQAKWLIMSYAPFALDFCPQRFRTRRISKITCVLRTQTVADCCCVNRQVNVSLLSTNKTNIKLL